MIERGKTEETKRQTGSFAKHRFFVHLELVYIFIIIKIIMIIIIIIIIIIFKPK